MGMINPLSSIGVTSIIRPMPMGNAAATQKPQGECFQSQLKKAVDNIDAKQKESHVAIADLVSGKTDNLLPVVNTMAKADLSFKLLVGVRNKMVDAYKETMRMQI